MKKPYWMLALRSFLSCSLAMAIQVAGAAEPESSAGESSEKPDSRKFHFRYGAELVDLPAGATVRAWLPVPQTTDHQKIKVLKKDLPGAVQEATEPKYSNQILYFEVPAAKSGQLDFNVTYKVKRTEVRGLQSDGSGEKLTAEQRKQFLSANAKVPVGGRPLELLAGVNLSQDDPLVAARQLYDRVDLHMRYDKSKPGYGEGDVIWACDSQFGNCTDFHSLFISFARSHGLPAQFEIGFPLPPERGQGTVGGYHCWALFFVDGRGWIPVDISEADKHPEMKEYYFGNLTEDRVTFSVGRDIMLVPQQDGPPLNFFVYPYVEVNGAPLPKDQINLRFAYEDQ